MKIILILLGFVFLSSCTLSKPNSKKSGFGFKNYEIYKTKEKNENLIVKDLDSDGLKDILMINNYDSTISIFYQLSDNESEDYKKNFHKNITQDTINDLSFDFKFKKTPFITEKNLKALNVADLGKGKRKDLVYLTSNGELFVAYQIKKRKFETKLLAFIPDFIPSLYSIYTKDINGDKKDDLIVLGRKFLYVFYQKNGLSEPIKFTYNAKNPLGVEVADLNGDGLNDILFVTSGGINQLKVRFQQKDNTLGPEHSIDYPNFTYLIPKDILKNKIGSELLSIRGNENFIFVDKIVKSKKGEFPKSVVYSLDPEAQNPTKSTLFNDFNKDGNIDMVVSDSTTPFLMYFKGKKGVFNQYKKLPSFKGITKIKMLKTSKGKEVLIYSKEEKSLALYNLNKKLPKILNIEGSIEGVDVFKNKIYLLVKKGEGYDFERYSIKNKKLIKENSIKLELESEPANIMVIDFNYDKKADLLVLSPYDNTEFFQSKNSKLEKIKVNINAVVSFFKSIPSSQIGFYDYNKDGKKEFVVSNKNIVRGFKFKNNQFEIIYQINGMANNSDLTNLVKAKINGDFFFSYDRMSHKLSIFKKDYTFLKNIKVPNLLVNKIVLKDLDKDGNKELILLARKAVAVFNIKKAGYRLKNILTYQLPNPKAISTILEVGNFDGKKIISVDGARAFIDFLKIKNNKISFDMKFKVFDKKSYRGGKSTKDEPKSIVIADMDNNKKDDIIIHVHNKIIIYYQK